MVTVSWGSFFGRNMYCSRFFLSATAAAAVSADFYVRLGIPDGAAEPEIKSAYRRRALQCHPDLVNEGPLKADAEKEFRQISEAYQCLTNPTERRRYDAKRKKASVKQPASAASPINVKVEKDTTDDAKSKKQVIKPAASSPKVEDWQSYEEGFYTLHYGDEE